MSQNRYNISGPPNLHQRTESNNPFENDKEENTGFLGKLRSTNPFAGGFGGGGGGGNPFGEENTAGSSSGTNPFGDDNPSSGGGGMAPQSLKGSSNNPFDSSGGGGGVSSSSNGQAGSRGVGSGMNPFGSSSVPQNPPEVGGPLNPFGDSPARTGGGSNPFNDKSGGGGGNDPGSFNFDPDFQSSQKRSSVTLQAVGGLFRQRGGGGGGGAPPHGRGQHVESGNGGDYPRDQTPILAGMDAEDNGEEESVGGSRHRRNQSEAVGVKVTPLKLARSKTGDPAPGTPGDHRGAKNIGAVANLTTWLRGGANNKNYAGTANRPGSSFEEYDGLGGLDAGYNGSNAVGGHMFPDKSRAKKKNHRKAKRSADKNKTKIPIQSWPYDDYHKQQEQMYETLSRAASYSSSDENYNDSSDGGGKVRPLDVSDMNNKLYERPAELPTIKEAVQGLSLVDFEKKAEERGIAIVSTWLHDSGLIDDLMVTGMNEKHPQRFNDAVSVKTSEGIEVGAQGFPIEGLKMEKEIDRLRRSTQRELSLINSRLNDGVAASGSEVQELVNAVAATKSDLGKLRSLTTYITEGCKDRDEFILSNCPRLRKAINARRNLFRCFRELEFFDQMPATCERLREELHSGEWTTNEWTTIRSVSMEHVELEILLVEAEAGMKARLTEDATDHSSSYRDRSKYEDVDRFLSVHVKNVWELGDEIRMRILSGIGSSFDLALNNPASMVALVEAVEVYERAAEQYQALYDDTDVQGKPTLRFTDMRASALAQIYQDFELRGVEKFRIIHMHAADCQTEEDNDIDTQFNAVLRASTELVSDIELVKNKLAPCFAAHWAVEVLWCSCVAHVCSNQILQQIGGPEGNSLPDLNVIQLLDLVAWIEFFRGHIEDSFPNVAKIESTKKTYLDTRPDLFAGDKKEVDMESANDSLAWVNNMLWEVHRLAQSEFLQRTRDQTDDWFKNIYNATHTQNETQEGRLTTSLCEDVFGLVGVQLRTLRDHLSNTSEALVMASCLVFSLLRVNQIHSRNNFLNDLESACAAANDFYRMSERCEEVMAELQAECKFPDDVRKTLDESASEVLSLYSADAVYSAQSIHVYIFEPISDAIADKLFSEEWENDMTHNELALTLVRTIEDFLRDLEQFLDEFLVIKSVDALVTATVVFYVRCLLMKAEKHASGKVGCFLDVHNALERITGDIRIMREYFEGLIPRMPSLKRVIEKEFEFLTTMHECMAIAADISETDASDFIIVVHKQLGHVFLTKHFLGDLWHLIAPTNENSIWELVGSMEAVLEAMVPKSEEAIRQAKDRLQVPGLRLDKMMAELYLQSKRKLPIKNARLKDMMENLKNDWSDDS